jgi:glutathione S-transferase
LSSSQNRKGLLLVTSSVALYSKSREKFNPFGEMMSNLFDAATSSVDTGKVNDELESELQSCNVPAWEEIRGLLESKQTEEEKLFRENLKSGIGEGSPMHALRRFDESNKEEDVRITFYRDSASWCPYCQKVWMTLEEKRIPYKIGKFIA